MEFDLSAVIGGRQAVSVSLLIELLLSLLGQKASGRRNGCLPYCELEESVHCSDPLPQDAVIHTNGENVLDTAAASPWLQRRGGEERRADKDGL